MLSFIEFAKDKVLHDFFPEVDPANCKRTLLRGIIVTGMLPNVVNCSTVSSCVDITIINKVPTLCSTPYNNILMYVC